jgi:hypothetical protein
MNDKTPSEPRKGGIMTAKAYAAPTELTLVIGWAGLYKDIAPSELGAAGTRCWHKSDR